MIPLAWTFSQTASQVAPAGVSWAKLHPSSRPRSQASRHVGSVGTGGTCVHPGIIRTIKQSATKQKDALR